MRKIKGILLSTGYAESSTNVVACLDWKGEKPFAMAEDCVRQFYEDVYAIHAKPRTNFQKCCTATLEALPNAKFCATCRRDLIETPASAEDCADYLRSMSCTADDSYDMERELAEKGWVLFGSFCGTYVVLHAADYALLYPTNSTAQYGIVTIKPAQGSVTYPVKDLELSFLRKLKR